MSENDEEIEFTEEKPQKVEITHKIVKEEKGKEKNPEKTEEDEEKEHLKAVIGMIAEKEFNEKRREVAKELNLDEDVIKDPSDLKAYQQILAKQRAEKSFGKKSPPSSSGVPLSNEQTGDNRYVDPTLAPRFREYDSEIEMILDLQKTAKESEIPEIRKEAEEALAQLWKKSLKDLERGGEWEFQGEITKSIQTKAFESPEEKLKRKKESSKWKRKK